MNIKIEEYWVEKYPKLFQEYNNKKSSMYYDGCKCGDGWFHILDELWEELSKEDVILDQVKEKFGLLCVNIKEYDDLYYNIIQNAEIKSSKVCELCGSPANIQIKENILFTLCDKCFILEKNLRKYINKKHIEEIILEIENESKYRN